MPPEDMLLIEGPRSAVEDPAVQTRVTVVDLVGPLAAWLVAKLQDKHPDANPLAILGWLRGCTISNSMWFVRTPHAAGLAEITRVPLEVQPIATEHFMFAEEGHEDEAADLYPSMASWAANQNASMLFLHVCSDVSRAALKSKVGQFYTKGRSYMSLGRLD